MSYAYQELGERIPYEDLKELSFSELSTEEAVRALGQIIDGSFDRKDSAFLSRVPQLAELLFERSDLKDVQRAELDYFFANYWSNRRIPGSASGRALEDLDGVVHEIFHLRRSVNEQGFDDLSVGRRVQILTNLGNVLSNIGRTPEALEYWESANAMVDGFGMALGNRGYGLFMYGLDLQDPHEIVLLLRQARADLSEALKMPLEGMAGNSFHAALDEVQRLLDDRDDDHISMPSPVEGDQEELFFRHWCAAHRLFLNPLNDIGAGLEVARDPIMTSPILVPIDSGPRYLGFLSQIKQEYVSARYFAYLGLHSQGPHFSDHYVRLANTLDYPSFSLSTEYSKSAFRSAYALFDKIAFFLNAYFALRIREKQVSFRTLWFQSSKPSKSIRENMSLSNNRPLGALYWLSRDLYERDPFQQVMEPDARELAETRHHLEHRYLKLHLAWPEETESESEMSFQDDLAHSMARTDFEDRLLRLLRMARCAIIYLCLAVTREERIRDQREEREVARPIRTGIWEDEWKL